VRDEVSTGIHGGGAAMNAMLTGHSRATQARGEDPV